MADKLSKGRRIPHVPEDPEAARAFARAFNSVDPLAAMREAVQERDRLRALLAAYGRAVEDRREDAAADALRDIEEEARAQLAAQTERAAWAKIDAEHDTRVDHVRSREETP